MSINQIKKMALHYTLLLVFVMGLLSVFTLVSKPKGLDFETSSSKADRSPANVSTANGLMSSASDGEVTVIQYDCKKSDFRVGGSLQVRIRGRTCQGSNGERIQNSDIRNQATGLAATVFFSNEANNFTTDLIQLKMGTNRITIDNKMADGKSDHSEILITAHE